MEESCALLYEMELERGLERESEGYNAPVREKGGEGMDDEKSGDGVAF
jgi:hypothetical protein